MTDQVELAWAIMQRAHGEQLDKKGRPFINHPINVRNIICGVDGDATTTEEAAALLHDVLEDTNMEVADLRRLGVRADVIEVVLIVTRQDGETYFDFIRRIVESGNPAALRVKLADVTHNLGRCIGDGPEFTNLAKRYGKTLAILTDAL